MEKSVKTNEKTVSDEKTDVKTEAVYEIGTELGVEVEHSGEIMTHIPKSEIEKMKNTIRALKGARTRDRNRFRSVLSDRAKVSDAIEKVVPETLLIKRGDIYRIFNEYSRLVREELKI